MGASGVTAPLLAALACAPAGPRPFPPPDAELISANRAAGDPFGGRFPLERALDGLPAEGELWAVIVTDAGEIPCRLAPEDAPLSVANFVGLARGRRPFRDAGGRWITAPYYDGSEFYRAEGGLFVQGGRRDGREDVGFHIQDEVGVGDDFHRPGVLAMANAGPDTTGAQFFITTGDVQHLAGHHTILGQCGEGARVRDLERRVERGERPRIATIRVERR